ncbi:MAG TPA: ATP-dependent DNA helicase RecG [Clostridiales bacterium]|nr:ATP-dependent DNA helicase RecG [Clostridiales bacterium]
MASENKSIRYFKGVGEKRARLFYKLGVFDYDTLINFYPRTYQDWSKITQIKDAEIEQICCIKATVISPPVEHYVRKNMILYKFKAQDRSGVINITLFNNKYLANSLKVNNEYLFYGKVMGNWISKEMSSPEIKPVTYAMIRPIYRTTNGLSSAAIENVVRQAIDLIPDYDPIPAEIREKHGLCPLRSALKDIHFPKDFAALKSARDRLIFQELFFLQLGLLKLKDRSRSKTKIKITKDYTQEFIKGLPYTLTNAQQRVIKECVGDLLTDTPMNRLVQGDVGSGKTVVAAALCHTVIKNGYQAAIMAPTEILAEQHFDTLRKLLEASDIKIELLSGSLTKKQKSEILKRLSGGETQLVIGTHALIEDNVEFKSLGLVVTDEQHRFGVAQRGALSNKGDNPHLLVMSATPIPRTLALIIYGDLDISIIDELPKGRQPVKTYVVKSNMHERIYNFIKKHVKIGRQAYIVCPLIEDSDTGSLVSAESYYEKLSAGAFKGYKLGLLHGKLRPAEKEQIMRRFVNREIDILISTTVIEVGVNVPNAVIMVIENAERFGLSQLHQLRGRVGRGSHESYCILISDSENQETLRRLNIMCTTTDGFKIADEDLKLRGPGDFFGSRQHGLPDLKIADMTEDIGVLRQAAAAAKGVLDEDPELLMDKHKGLKAEIEKLFEKNQKLGFN